MKLIIQGICARMGLCNSLIYLMICISSIAATECGSVTLRCRSDAGMFSVFDDVLALLSDYDDGYYSGIEVDFAQEGLYYEPGHGDNWWTYYCEPICLGIKSNNRHHDTYGYQTVSFEFETIIHAYNTCGSGFEKIIQRSHELINKYIRIKPEIVEEVRRFHSRHFDGFFVISIHYRGTDKIKEVPRVRYGQVVAKINETMKKYGNRRYKIFVATDEQQLLNRLVERYGIDMVCYNTDAFRASDGKPLHIGRSWSKYKCGFDAMIDAILLSQGNYLIRNSSNLSRWSIFFEPTIPVCELHRR